VIPLWTEYPFVLQYLLDYILFCLVDSLSGGDYIVSSQALHSSLDSNAVLERSNQNEDVRNSIAPFAS
jgi:hypothetical protein